MTRSDTTSTPVIPGYDYGTSKSAVSPVSESELAQLEQTIGWTSEDVSVLARHVAVRPHDRDWLNYQHEIGLRHTPAKKNKTDGAHTPPVVPFRYLLAFVPVVLPVRGFFTDAIKTEQELKKLEDAWTKAVVLHITLWSRAYISGDMW